MKHDPLTTIASCLAPPIPCQDFLYPIYPQLLPANIKTTPQGSTNEIRNTLHEIRAYGALICARGGKKSAKKAFVLMNFWFILRISADFYEFSHIFAATF